MPIRITDENEPTTYFLRDKLAIFTMLIRSGDTMQGDLDMNRNKITNVKYPSDVEDAANKLYVDLNLARVTFPFKIIPLHIDKVVGHWSCFSDYGRTSSSRYY